MREIKFRAWHKNMKSMCQNVTTDLSDRDYLEFMQYTGLADKNSKEIYEGDILKKQGCWLIKVEYDKGCFILRDVDSVRYNNLICDSFTYDFPLEDWEVIGNIYENPELLN